MVIPQFSIRWLLAVTAVCAVVFSVFGLAVRGQLWAVGVSAAVLSLVVAMFVYAALFTGVWVFSAVISPLLGGKGRAGGSPFRQVPFAQVSPSDPEVPATPILLE
jgi:hypothetical protein